MEKMVRFKDIGKCPHCGNTEYGRVSIELFEDVIFAKCKCTCGNSFGETFRLLSQYWNIHGG